MAHYAWLNNNNIVVNVIVGKDEDDLLDGEVVDWEEVYLEKAALFRNDVTSVKRTSYNTLNNIHINNETGEASNTQEKKFRGNYATIGGHYLPDEDIFIEQKEFNSWILDIDNAKWIPPVPRPDDYEVTPYHWDEETQTWAEGNYDTKPNNNYT